MIGSKRVDERQILMVGGARTWPENKKGNVVRSGPQLLLENKRNAGHPLLVRQWPALLCNTTADGGLSKSSISLETSELVFLVAEFTLNHRGKHTRTTIFRQTVSRMH